MENNINRKIIIGLIPISMLVVVVIMFINSNKSSDVSINNATNNAVTNVSESTSYGNSENSNTNSDSSTSVQSADTTTVANVTLAVSSYRCRGCGKCARIDSEHFKMSGGVATVISQNNLDSNALANAINVCDAGAITLS